MRYFISTFFAAMVVFGSVSAWANTSSKESYMLMELKSGMVKIALRDDLAPSHVERIRQLVRRVGDRYGLDTGLLGALGGC